MAVARNPPWSTDEIVLALALYFEYGWLDDTDSRVIELSGILNGLPHTAGDATTFRNPNGVAMKLGRNPRTWPSSAQPVTARSTGLIRCPRSPPCSNGSAPRRSPRRDWVVHSRGANLRPRLR